MEKDAEDALIFELKQTNPKAFIIWENERKKRKTVLDYKQELLMVMTVKLAQLVNARYNFHTGNVEGKRPEDEVSIEQFSPYKGRSNSRQSDMTSARGSVHSSIRHQILKGKVEHKNTFNQRMMNKAVV
jgi:hypothetical protein